MKKKYRAVGAMSLVLVTAFISVYGVGIINSKATTLGYPAGVNTLNTYDTTPSIYETTPSVDGTTQSTSTTQYENGNTVEPGNPNNPGRGTYGEWVVIKEPTYEEEGLRRREFKSYEGSYSMEYESIPRLKRPDIPTETMESTTETSSEILPSNELPTETSSEILPSNELPTETSSEILPSNELPTETETSKEIPSKEMPSEVPSTADETPATRSNSDDYHIHRGSGRVNSVRKLGNVKKEDIIPQSSTEVLSSEDIEESSMADDIRAENVKPVKSNVGKSEKKNKKSRNVNSTVPETVVHSIEDTEETKESEYIKASTGNKQTPVKITEAATESKEVIVTKVDNDIPESKSYDNSFNRYDGATLLAAGVYAWWAVIILLPMVNASKWINKKRKEKLRGNVNKKYN